MQRRVNKIEKPETPAPITSPANANEAPSAPAQPFNPAQEMQQVNVLYSLLENKYTNAYPMPQSLRHPRSSPSHYDDVMKEMSEAPSRSWLSSLTKKIQGSFRLS
jgi:cytochrome b pre-mRNA-processing protein 6